MLSFFIRNYYKSQWNPHISISLQLHYWNSLVNQPLTSVPIDSSPSVPAHYTWEDWTFPCLLLLLTGMPLSFALSEDLHGSLCECPLNFEEVCIVHQAPDQVVWDFISSRSFVIGSLVSQVQQDTREVWRRLLSMIHVGGLLLRADPTSYLVKSESWLRPRDLPLKWKSQKGADNITFTAAERLDWKVVCLCCWYGDSSGSGDLSSVF